jgi:ubiquinone biosynthesis protein
VLKKTWIPTPLVAAQERVPVPIVPLGRDARFRTLYVFLNFAGLALALSGLVLLHRFDRQAYARRVRRVFERMGGLWIKAGQLMSLRIDMFPLEICRELAKLQSQALGFSPDLAHRLVEAELDAPLEQYFDEWDATPFAAASIGQVHLARLRNEQVRVAVKIQKPGSRELFGRDLTFIRWTVRAIKLLRIYPHMKWDDGFRELQQIMKEELDFGYEASATRRMRRNLRAHGIYVPKVFSRYCTARVLVTEFLPVVLMADYIRVLRQDPDRARQWDLQNEFVPRRAARGLVHSFQRQMLEDNFFHGDMHPGNIGLLKGSRLALIDFGTTNFTEADYLRRFQLFMRALAMQEFAKAADMCLMLCASLPPIDIQLLRERLIRTIRWWASRTLVRELPYHDKSMDNLTLEVMKVLLGFRCTMEWAWLRLHRASSTLDASLIELFPGIDYRKVTAEYFVKADRRRVRTALRGGTASRSVAAIGKAFDIQSRLREYAMLQATLVRRQARSFRAIVSKAGVVIATLADTGLILVSAQTAVAAALALRGWNPGAVDRAIGSTLAGAAGRLPALEPQTALVILLVDAWLVTSLWHVRRAVARRDLNISRATVAVA